MDSITKYVVITSAHELSSACHAAADNAGWWKLENGVDVRLATAEVLRLWVAAKLALVHSEVSEALEGYRKDQMDQHLPHRKAIEVELADALIRICDLAGGLKLDLGGAVAEKMEYNAQRADHNIANRGLADGKKF